MAQLEQQIASFGERLAVLEVRAGDGAQHAQTLVEMQARLAAMAKAVAAIETHDTRQDIRLTAIEAEQSRAAARLDDIEMALGALGMAAEQVAARSDVA